jgi:hypothetical protein
VVLYDRDSNLLGCFKVSTLPTFRRCVISLPLGQRSPLLLDCVNVNVNEGSAHVREEEILWPLPGIEPRAYTECGKTPCPNFVR